MYFNRLISYNSKFAGRAMWWRWNVVFVKLKELRKFQIILEVWSRSVRRSLSSWVNPSDSAVTCSPAASHQHRPSPTNGITQVQKQTYKIWRLIKTLNNVWNNTKDSLHICFTHVFISALRIVLCQERVHKEIYDIFMFFFYDKNMSVNVWHVNTENHRCVDRPVYSLMCKVWAGSSVTMMSSVYRPTSVFHFWWFQANFWNVSIKNEEKMF